MTLDTAEQLVRRLSALGDPVQRVAVLTEEAERLGLEAFSDLLAVLVARGSSDRSEPHQLTLVAAMDFLESEYLDDDRRAALLLACREANHRQLVRLLFNPAGKPEADERVPDYGTGRPLTLGERKSLARRPSRQVLERVMADPHPDVIHNLLRNAKLTEADVLRLVSRRPNSGKVLRKIYENHRWSRRYAIKVALARNPYTPPTLALKLIHQLMRQDLRELLGDRNLHPDILTSSRLLLDGEPPPDDLADGTDVH